MPALVAVALLAVAWLLFKPAGGGANGLPALTLERLEGGSVHLASSEGKPVVVNLWATWCPPCRRELPMLARAARTNPSVRFYFVDQGEAPATVRGYLAERPDLDIEGVLLDPGSVLSDRFGAAGLPVTLFFDARGNHVLTHRGEVTEVDLLNYLTDLKRGTL